MTPRVLLSVALLTLVTTRIAAAQERGFSVGGSLGSNINAGGESRSVSVGYSPGGGLDFIISAERLHVPTKVTHFENGFSVSRGGTTEFISGEVRFSPGTFNRVSPYGLTGVGRGRARPNVNEHFPNRVDYGAALLFVGGGARVALTRHLEAFGDVRCMLQLDTSESGVFGFLPVRGGLAWRF